MSNWYISSTAVGANNGTSLANAWTSFASVNQASIAADDIVYVRSGIYNERFTITKGGTSGHRINYVANGSGSPILLGINGASVSNVAIIGLEIRPTGVANSFTAISLSNSTGWLVQDNYFHDTYLSAIDCISNTINSYNVIRGNRFYNLGSISGGYGGNGSVVGVSLLGHYNLIEYNSINLSMDRTRAFGSGNVIRNNYWGYTDTSLYPLSSPYPFHSDGFQAYEGALKPQKLLYEKNWDVDNRDTVGGSGNAPNGHGFIVQDGADTNDFNWYVLRFNTMVREAESVMLLRSIRTMRYYNNTMIGIGADKTSNFNAAIGFEVTGVDHDYRNNAFAYNPRMLDAGGIITTTTRPSGFTSAANYSYNTGASQCILPVGANPPNLGAVAPSFTNGSGVSGFDNYTLTTGSILRNSGAYLTRASGTGNNSISLGVFDAKFIFDGWGIVDADYLKISTSGTFIQVSGIDYNTNVITLSSPTTWNSGDGIYIKGTEDVGSQPFSYVSGINITNTTSLPLISGLSTLSATTNTPSSVRKIEFLIDGLPIGEAYSSPYQTSYTSTGGSPIIEARAYNMWASPILTVSSFASGQSVTYYLTRMGRHPKFRVYHSI
jgi:hypothetical protein